MVKVLFFAKLKEIIKEHSIHMDCVNIKEVCEKLKMIYPQAIDELSRCMIAVNENYVSDYSFALKTKDVIALIPPVSGG